MTKIQEIKSQMSSVYPLLFDSFVKDASGYYAIRRNFL